MTDAQHTNLAFDYPEVKMHQVWMNLQRPHPVWLLSPKGVVTAANQLAIWLWEAQQPKKLLGTNAFKIISKNITRIPKDKNREFFCKKSAVVKRLSELYGQQPYISFITDMKNDPTLRVIYEWEIWIPESEWESDREWRYALIILPPCAPSTEKFLEFRVVVSRLEGNGGYLAIYRPSPHSPFTNAVVEQEHARAIEFSDIEEYVQYQDSIRKGPYYSDCPDLTHYHFQKDTTENEQFQTKFREAFLSLIQSSKYVDILKRFQIAYEYRRQFPWLGERGGSLNNNINNDGLSYALQAALATYLPPKASSLEYRNTLSIQQSVHSNSEKIIEGEWVSSLTASIKVLGGFSLERFKNRLSHAEVNIDTITIEGLQMHIAEALVGYYDHRMVGTSPDPF